MHGGAACIIRLKDKTGSIKVGKYAGIIAIKGEVLAWAFGF